MCKEEIMQILKETYEICAHTTEVNSSAVRGSRLYFYTLDVARLQEAEAVCQALSGLGSSAAADKDGATHGAARATRFGELRSSFGGRKWLLPQCACLEDCGGNWQLGFYPIKGLRYHRTYGGRMTASLILDNYPLVELYEGELATFYGYWHETTYKVGAPGEMGAIGELVAQGDVGAPGEMESLGDVGVPGEMGATGKSESLGDVGAPGKLGALGELGSPSEKMAITAGMNYRVNKNLMSNVLFRRFTVDFFKAVSKAEGKYILRDIAGTIERTGCFLPSVPFRSIRSAHNPNEVLKPLTAEAFRDKINFNRLDMNVGYVRAALLPLVHDIDRGLVYQLDRETVMDCLTESCLFSGMKTSDSVAEFISNYYVKVRGFAEGEEARRAREYAKACLDEKLPVRLSASYGKMKALHYQLMNHMRMREYLEAGAEEWLVPRPSHFDRLEAALELLCPGDFQRMRTAGQLLSEGEFQHNCVQERAHCIREDQSAIFHWSYAGEDYTVEIGLRDISKYYIKEIRTRFNRPCKTEALTRLQQAVKAAGKENWQRVLRMAEWAE